MKRIQIGNFEELETPLDEGNYGKVKFFREWLEGQTFGEFKELGELGEVWRAEGGPGLLDDERNWERFGRLEGRSPDLWMIRGIR